jgi:hypothetical protein
MSHFLEFPELNTHLPLGESQKIKHTSSLVLFKLGTSLLNQSGVLLKVVLVNLLLRNGFLNSI